MTYFRMGNPHYHRRGVVSLSCLGWEGVGPTRYGRQTNCCRNQDTGFRIQPETRTLPDVSGRSKVFMCFDCNASGSGYRAGLWFSPQSSLPNPHS